MSKDQNVVQRATALFAGDIDQFADRLSKFGPRVLPTDIQKWELVGVIPPDARRATCKAIEDEAQRLQNEIMNSGLQNVVDRAIAKFNGSPSELARRLSAVSGTEISRQRVHGWCLRGIFPRLLLRHVSQLTGIGLEELLAAKPKKRERGTPVDQAIAKCGGTASRFAEKLTQSSGRDVTRQMVNNWQISGRFPRDWVLDVHVLTKFPVKLLLGGSNSKD